MAHRPVLEQRRLQPQAVSDHELEVGAEHAKKEYGRSVDSNLLRIIANTVFRKWGESRSVKLPFLAATVVRETVPPTTKDRVEMIQAYKGAVMKIMSSRSATKRSNDARKRQQGVSVPPAVKQTEHPADPKRETQLLLL